MTTQPHHRYPTTVNTHSPVSSINDYNSYFINTKIEVNNNDLDYFDIDIKLF